MNDLRFYEVPLMMSKIKTSYPKRIRDRFRQWNKNTQNRINTLQAKLLFQKPKLQLDPIRFKK